MGEDPLDVHKGSICGGLCLTEAREAQNECFHRTVTFPSCIVSPDSGASPTN